MPTPNILIIVFYGRDINKQQINTDIKKNI
jgi:hypothetical protein